MIGKILGSAVKVVNAPLDAADSLLLDSHGREKDRMMSAPLAALARSLDEVDEGDSGEGAGI